MPQSNSITPEQRAYILDHINDRPRNAVAQRAGVSLSTVYRIARKMGADMHHERNTRNPHWVAIVRKYYPTMAGHEIERRFGITHNRANKIAADLGIRHTPETEARLREEAAQCLKRNLHKMDHVARAKTWKRRRRMDELRILSGEQQRTEARLREEAAQCLKRNLHKMDHVARAKTWKRRRRMDELRILSGEQQRTGFRFGATTLRAYKAMHHLVHVYGYIRHPDEPYTLLYDEGTRRRIVGPESNRRVGTEQYYEKKYHINFKEQQ